MLCLARGRSSAGFQVCFGVEAWHLACSHCRDFVWSGENIEKLSGCVFFAEVKCRFGPEIEIGPAAVQLEMWTFRVAVAISGIGVDANLRILQLEDRATLGIAELREETPYRGAIPVGARGGLGVNREVSGVGCPRFFVSQAVSSGLCPDTCVVPSRSVSSDLDTLTPLLELYVRLRERRQHWYLQYHQLLEYSWPQFHHRQGWRYPMWYLYHHHQQWQQKSR
ncbi:hypothetical protein Taro_034017 [Colocasia esculenta]|uniref:Uncharacterized protein n=1 Tax=Colocasia esculenta TaxID=4460 RepID=A0A843W8Q5_COLES|nr:hypothetical protein [Colocasia esculenta]